jgi:oligopeptide transport system substrate-binding protein
MQKRLLGILASISVIAAACGGATTSTAPTAVPSTGTGASEAPGSSASAGASAPTSSGASGPIDPAGVLHVSLGSEDPDTLDPSKASTSTDISVLHALGRGLLYLDKDLNVVPALATAMPTVSADGLTYTFTLKDAKYSNGDPIVAGDIVYAWQRLIDPRLATYYQQFLGPVKGADDILKLNGTKASDATIDAALAKLGVAAPDPKTFVLTLAHPSSYILDIVALWGTAPMEKKWITSPNATEAANFVSSGPFMMKSWTHQAEIVLVPNPNWYGTKPQLSEIDFKIGGDPAADQATFEAGQLDDLAASPPDVPRIKADPTLGPQVTTTPVLVFDYWGFNAKTGPTTNVHFRRALSMAIDKNTMLQTVYGGQGLVADSPIPPGMPGHQEGIGLKYDVAGAKTELAQALTELGIADVTKLPALSFGFNTNAGHELPAAFMQDQWRRNLGVNTTLVGETFDQFVPDRLAGKFTITRDAWGSDYPHPDDFLRALFGTGSNNNDENYSNKAFDALIAQAGAEIDPTKSIALYNQAQELLVQDAPAVFTRWRVANYEVAPYVTGITGTVQDSVFLGDTFPETIGIVQH